MSAEMELLVVTAASIGFFHTLAGPDHYLPFIAMAEARRWSLSRTAAITSLCGLGHVGSSVLLGFVGIAIGKAVGHLEVIESIRGDLAAWLLTAFGFTYFVWGIHRAIRNRPHRHLHDHGEGGPHEHEHAHESGHIHVHERGASVTPWVLFAIFVFGPCEPLIPILMYPAAHQGLWTILAVVAVFSAATIGTMLLVVLAGCRGLSLLPLKGLERYAHAIAGAAILLCGLAVLFLGL